MTPAHDQRVTLHILEHFPEHEPRASDPHYRHFNDARTRLKRLGKLVCWVGNEDCHGQIELHHSTVEFALANGVDVARFEELYPEFGCKNDEDFLRFVESEGNLTPLCMRHHRGDLGIHSMTYPSWLPQRFWKTDLPEPARLTEG